AMSKVFICKDLQRSPQPAKQAGLQPPLPQNPAKNLDTQPDVKFGPQVVMGVKSRQPGLPSPGLCIGHKHPHKEGPRLRQGFGAHAELTHDATALPTADPGVSARAVTAAAGVPASACGGATKQAT